MACRFRCTVVRAAEGVDHIWPRRNKQVNEEKLEIPKANEFQACYLAQKCTTDSN